MNKLSNVDMALSEYQNEEEDDSTKKYSQKGQKKEINNGTKNHKQGNSSNNSEIKKPFSQKRKNQNKQSAKKSRLRKKQRIVELETIEKQLQAELDKLKQQTSKTKAELEKQISLNTTTHIFNIAGRTQSYQRLSKIMESNQNLADQDEINLILDNLRNRVGATGCERQSKIIYIFKQIFHISFPALHRYLMWTAKNQTNYFGKNNPEDWTCLLSSQLNLTRQQQQFFQSTKLQFQNHYQTFLSLINQIKQTKKKLQTQSQKLQDLIQKMRCVLNPIQSVKFLTYIERNKYTKRMQLWSKRNMDRFSDQTIPPAIDPGVTKKQKIVQIQQ